MNSKERVVKALSFESPDKVPRCLWWSPAVEQAYEQDLQSLLHDFPLDIIDYRCIDALYVPGTSIIQQRSSYSALFPEHLGPKPLPPGEYIDEWGSVWRVPPGGVSGQVKEPVLTDLSKVNELRIPWEVLKSTDLGKVRGLCSQSEKFVLSGLCAHPFERMQFIRGTQELYIDLMRNRDGVLKLRDIVHRFTKESIGLWIEAGVDGIKLMDDWGAQNDLLISPSLWRELFKPLYNEYCELVHDAGKYAFFHSDGKIEKIFPDLVEIGIDAINSQLFLMDIEGLGTNFKGKITFWGEIDRQFVLRSQEPSRVAAAVRRVRRALEHPRGGAIAQCKWEIDHPATNIRTVFETWSEAHPNSSRVET